MSSQLISLSLLIYLEGLNTARGQMVIVSLIWVKERVLWLMDLVVSALARQHHLSVK